jgi:glutamate synthase domain-containing protein 3
MVELERLTESEEIDSVLHLLTLHREYTGSKRANDILENWNIEVGRFIKVMPTDYKKALLKMKEEEQSQKQGVAVNG